MNADIRPTVKQDLAWDALKDKVIKYLGFGGGAGGGKSWLGAEWLTTNCYFYPGSRWFIGRNELARLMKSSYITLEKVCRHHSIPQSDWKLNGQYNFISFKNGSRIDLLDLKYQPSDPMYQRLGSLEYTGGWIEEAGEIDFMGFDVLKSRIGRHENDKFGLIPAKMLLTFNPTKNWLYQLFYKPKRDGELPKEYEFIQSLYGDNPHTAETYGDELKEIKDKATKQRLMYGNWDYEDSATALFKYDALVDVFSNTVTKTGSKYLIVDIADDGSDKTVFSFWEDLEEYRREEYERLNTEGIVDKIREYAGQDRIPYSHIAVDAIGVGAGVASNSMLDGIIGFKSSYSAIKTDQDIVYLPNVSYTNNAKLVSDYKNLRSQCVFTLADLVNNHKVASKMEGKMKDSIIEELSIYKEVTKEGSKRQATPKEELKELLGRSPDSSDCFLMRMYFLIKNKMTTVDSPEGDSVTERQKEIFEKNEENYHKNSNK